MWGLFVGLGIGVAQVFAMRALIGMIMGTRKALGVLLLMLKIAAIAVLLWLVSTASLAALAWAAGGTLAGLILGFAAMQFLQQRTGKDGKDQNHG
jgi:hypothetical protein